MYNHYYGKAKTANCSLRGITLHEVTETKIIGNKNGVTLKEIFTVITEKKMYELYLDGELINKFSNIKTAMAMYKDFSA